MTNFKQISISPTASVEKAIEHINLGGRKCVFIVDNQQKLLGIFTDEDVRRYIYKNGNLQLAIQEVMNSNPVVFKKSEPKALKESMQKNMFFVYPIINEENHLVDALFWDDIDAKKDLFAVNKIPSSIETVIMAGGLGSRLYPFTQILPKALIPVGEHPICTHIINSFKEYGCSNFHLILNHKKNLIKAYYTDEEKDYQISFYDEEQFLGTAGGLFLLRGKMNDSFFVSNCDILVEVDYNYIYKFHKQEKNIITVIAAQKELQIPYGVIKTNENSIIDIEEKPKMVFLTNVGLYLLEPEVLDSLQDGEFIHMPDIITRHIKAGKKVGVFPVSSEVWLDMGQLEEMKNMQLTLEQKIQKAI